MTGHAASRLVLAGSAALLLVAGVYGWRRYGPRSHASRFRRAVADLPTSSDQAHIVTEDDLAALPPQVATYLRRMGAVGSPVAEEFRARLRGRIRSGPDQPWMPFVAEQVNSYQPTVARLFHMHATMKGLPVDVLHQLIDGRATMRGLALSMVPVVDAAGPQMDQAETVTLFNDLCLFVPSALLTAPVQWEPVDEHTVRATYSNAGHTITALLIFDEAGDLVDFVSDDRSMASGDGRTFIPMRWSTPVGEFTQRSGRRQLLQGEARWHAPGGDFSYIEMYVDGLEIQPVSSSE